MGKVSCDLPQYCLAGLLNDEEMKRITRRYGSLLTSGFTYELGVETRSCGTQSWRRKRVAEQLNASWQVILLT